MQLQFMKIQFKLLGMYTCIPINNKIVYRVWSVNKIKIISNEILLFIIVCNKT